MARAIVESVEFDVGETLIVADPCYVDKDDAEDGYGCLKNGGLELKAVPGRWTASIEMGDAHGDAGRVASLFASVAGRTGMGEKLSRSIGMADVDSGQMFVGCKSSLPLDYEALLNEYKDSDGEWQNLSMLVFEEGAVSSTGWGDGSYEVTAALDSEDRVCAVNVQFLETDEDRRNRERDEEDERQREEDEEEEEREREEADGLDD